MSMKEFKLGFVARQINLSLEDILPVRPLATPANQTFRYSAIISSIEEVGLVEPLSVYPEKAIPGKYIILDGHLRYYALKALDKADAACIVSIDDERYTYNARISRVSPIQEHAMITKAIRSGLSPERIAKALSRKTEEIRASMNLLEGVAPAAVEMLKTKLINAKAIRILKRVEFLRQIEMAEVMIATNNYTEAYARALLVGTKTDMIRHPEKSKGHLSPEDVARMEVELESIEGDFKGLEESYGEAVINLTFAKRYIKTLISNSNVVAFLKEDFPDIFPEFQAIAAMDSI